MLVGFSMSGVFRNWAPVLQLSSYDDADTCSKAKGSPAFQPPEVAAGATSFSGFKVDVWAAGVVLFNLLAAAQPFDPGLESARVDTKELERRITHGEWSFAPLPRLAIHKCCASCHLPVT